ncbi:Hypothetical predicted protein [Octopus vulgaris]|uniref:Uncharacterized protein n=1 Tax=Octopus vulgaris TaxID=6645 RepID=A0AA36EWA9_OCTVU|nr:Hypothetical predicted protein [Octopus vulgaris]
MNRGFNMESGMAFRLVVSHFIFLLLHLPHPAITFNLDTKSPIIFSGTKNTYFGYSVGLQANSNRARLLVGAPYEPLIRRENNFYQCDIEQHVCNRLFPSYAGGTSKTNRWLGVTVDTNPRKDNNFIVCSHRNITRQIDSYGEYVQQSGSCFEIVGTKIIVITNPGKKATAGISARYSQDANSIIIGTPTHGSQARGGYIFKNSQQPAQPVQGLTTPLNHTYAGYAVNMVGSKIILGIPRYQDYGAIDIGDELIEAPQSNQHKLTCFLGYPMREKSTISFLLTFIANWMPIPKDLEVNMLVTTDSVVPKEYLNKTVALRIPVKKKSVVKLFGISEPELYIHKSSSKDESMISHAFVLQNTGPSETQNLVFETFVPHLIIRNMTIMTLDSVKYDGMHDQNSSVVCTSAKSNYSEDDIQKIKKDIMTAVTYDCSWMNCINVTCNFKELKTKRSKKIQINIAIENRYLDVLKGEMLNIYINTTGKLKQEAKHYIIKVPDVEKTIMTRVYIQPLKPTLKWWIPAASILSGILIMVLVTIFLHEFGFFTRYKKLEEEKETLDPDGNENKKPNDENENR